MNWIENKDYILSPTCFVLAAYFNFLIKGWRKASSWSIFIIIENRSLDQPSLFWFQTMLKVFIIQVFGNSPIKNDNNKPVKPFKVDLAWRKGCAKSLPRSIMLSWLDRPFKLARTENASFNFNMMYCCIEHSLQAHFSKHIFDHPQKRCWAGV